MSIKPEIALQFRQLQIDNPLQTAWQAQSLRQLMLQNQGLEAANEPRTRAETPAPAQIAQLAERKTQWTKDRHHKEAVGLARGLLSLPEAIVPKAYRGMRQKAIDLGHPNAVQLPEQWTPELLPVLKMLASGISAEELRAAAAGRRVDPNVYDVDADLEGGTDTDMMEKFGGDGGPGGVLGDPLPGPAKKRSRVRRGKDRRR